MKKDALSDDKAMIYEYFLRKAHNCGRGGVAGADADRFRFLIHAAEKFITKKDEKNARTYYTLVGEIIGYVKTAVDKVLTEQDERLSQPQKEKLSDLYVQLSVVTDLPDIDTINEVVAKADKIFQAIGLKVGN